MRLAVIGCGYVGLSAGCGLAARGHHAACVDIDAAKVEALRRGELPFLEPGLGEQLRAGLREGRISLTTDLGEAMVEAELVLIAVDTPQGPDGACDLGALLAAASEIGALLRPGQLVVVKSTVVPGTTEGPVRRALEEASGLALGDRSGFGLAMVPEFLREGSAVADFAEPDRIVIGADSEQSAARVEALFSELGCPILRVGLREAEMIKYASNSLLATLISFSNEVAVLCEGQAGVDVERVLSGVRLDRRLSPVIEGRRIAPGILAYLEAGSGFGGSCLPKDVGALSHFAAEEALPTPLLRAVLEINGRRPAQVAELLAEAVGAEEPGHLEGLELAVLGLTFKPGTDDLRSSPALALAEELRRRGARVRGWDPTQEAGPRSFGEAVSTPEEALEGAHGAVIATAWPELRALPWAALFARMARPVLLDGRGALRGLSLPEGLRYVPIGRRPVDPREER